MKRIISLAVLIAICCALTTRAQDKRTAATSNDTPTLAEKKEYFYKKQLILSVLSDVLRRESFVREMEISKQQVSDIGRAVVSYSRATQTAQSKVWLAQQRAEEGDPSADADAAQAALFESQYEALRQFIDAADEVLLPFQMERIEQLARQKEVYVLKADSDVFQFPLVLPEELKLTAVQKKEVQAKLDAARAKFFKELDAICEDASRDIKASLPPDKRKEFDKLFGDIDSALFGYMLSK